MIGKKRLNYIDIARAVAMIIIVIGHTFVHSAHCKIIYYYLYSFNIALFFILSGYTYKVYDKFKDFLKNKFIRIMVPYFIWAVLFIIPYLLFGSGISNKFNMTHSNNILVMLKNVLYGISVNDELKQNTSLWFLPALFSMEIIYYFVITYFEKVNDLLKFLIMFLIGYITSIYLKIYLPWGINIALQAGAYTFYLGYLLKKYNVFDKLFKVQYMIPLPIIGIIAYILDTEKISYSKYKYGIYPLTVIVGVSISIFIIYICYLIKKNKVLEYIGKNTMGILLFHKIIILVFQTKLGIVSKLLRDSNMLIELLITIIITSITIIFSLAVTQIIKKIAPIMIGLQKKQSINNSI